MSVPLDHQVARASVRRSLTMCCCVTVSLDGALGKIATRTRSAPRPLLQVTPSQSSASVPTVSGGNAEGEKSTGSPPPGSTPPHDAGESLLTGAGLIAKSATASESPATDGPLSHRDALAIIERLYDTVLDLEQLRRIHPALLATEAGLKDQFEQMTVEGEVKEQLRERYEEASSKVRAGDAKYEELKEALWQGLRVMDPLDAW